MNCHSKTKNAPKKNEIFHTHSALPKGATVDKTRLTMVIKKAM